MTIELDHVIVSVRNQVEAAKRLAELLGVPWVEKTLGPISAVYVNPGLTLDFIQTDEAFPVEHICFGYEMQSSIRSCAAYKPQAFPSEAKFGARLRSIGCRSGAVTRDDREE